MKKPLVGIVMGSDSDLPVMEEAAKVLKDFGIPYEMTISSAHRTPKRTSSYARGAEKRGIKVIIAGALKVSIPSSQPFRCPAECPLHPWP
jgi:5-(carboxyamino)imidazole ribonucleotide mutase